MSVTPFAIASLFEMFFRMTVFHVTDICRTAFRTTILKR